MRAHVLPTVEVWADHPQRQRAQVRVAQLVPWNRAAYSVGQSRPSDERFTWSTGGNSASENFAFEGGHPGPRPTDGMLAACANDVAVRMRANGHGVDDIWRITSHDLEAWPRGRKADVQAGAWLDLPAFRERVRALLASGRALTLTPTTDTRTSPNHTPRADGSRVQMYVLHWSGGGFEGTVDWTGRTHAPDGKRIWASYHRLYGRPLPRAA